MNKLPLTKRTQILAMLCEGSSMRSISRVADVSINTVSKLLAEAGEACLAIHDELVRNVESKRVQCDEIWSFCYAKEKNVAKAKAAPDGCRRRVDVDRARRRHQADDLLCRRQPRSGRCAATFMFDLQSRLANRVQLSTDGHGAYVEAVEGAFGGDVDFAQLVKLYAPAIAGPGRYSPPRCTGAKRKVSGWQPRSGAYQHVLCRADEPQYPHGQPALHPLDERLFQEAGEPCSRDCALLRVLQFLSHP